MGIKERQKIKEKISKIIRNRTVTKAMYGIGATVVGGVMAYTVSNEIKKNNNNNNERANQTWRENFENADSIVADAKNNHFYAGYKIPQEDISKLKIYLHDLKEERKNWLAFELADELQSEEGDMKKIDELFAAGARVDAFLLEDASKNIYSIRTDDPYKMMDRLLKQYEKYGSFDCMRASHRVNWRKIRDNFSKQAEGDKRCLKYANFANEEMKKLNANGRGSFTEESTKFDVDFYAERYFVLYPNEEEMYPQGKLGVLNNEIKNTEREINTGYRSVEATLEVTKEILSTETDGNPATKSIQKGYVEYLKLTRSDRTD